MSFETDKQTLDDLNLLGKYKNNSVYSLYVGTITRGGERKMEDMFLHPLTDASPLTSVLPCSVILKIMILDSLSGRTSLMSWNNTLPGLVENVLL